MKIKELRKVFMNGILNENPTFRLLLGMCPTLAISKAASSGLGMGLAATFVLVFSNLVISLLRNIIPEKVRIPSFVVVIATFVTIIDLLIKAFLPSMSSTLGIYIPLIVVNHLRTGGSLCFQKSSAAFRGGRFGNGAWFYAGADDSFFHSGMCRAWHHFRRSGHARQLSAYGLRPDFVRRVRFPGPASAGSQRPDGSHC